MEPPAKRPRLSMFRDDPSGDDLSEARLNNDLTLKGRFESIFAKYAQDFSGIGDEINIMTGEVVVNNGHLESIETETDAGISHLDGDFASTGRSMLRAMTVTLNPDLVGPDDVLMSIESIAENAALTDDSSTGESEDNLFDTTRLTTSISPPGGDEAEANDLDMEPYNSDSDSLFDQHEARFGSPDSLFGFDSNRDTGSVRHEDHLQEAIESSNQPTGMSGDDEDIIAKFGPSVGKQVINLIGQRQDALIEPMWRIPVKLNPKPKQPVAPRTISSSSSVDRSPSSKRFNSLWKAPRPRPHPIRQTSSLEHSDREESIDPLQEDPVSDVEPWDQPQEDIEEEEQSTCSDPDYQPETNMTRDFLLRAALAGDCAFCSSNFANKSGVMAHWDRLLRLKHKKGKGKKVHNFNMMKRIRSGAIIRVRFPRLVVYDFRTMVELHEGAGLSFDEIAKSKTLRTHKPGLKLQEVYNQHRTPPSWDDTSTKVRPWTEAEEELLEELCKNPLATIATLRRGLKGRQELDIGNHLADLWLKQLRNLRNAPVPLKREVDDQSVSLDASSNQDIIMSSTVHSTGSNAFVIKEESDDELLG